MTRRLHIRVAALAAVATLGLAACADSGGRRQDGGRRAPGGHGGGEHQPQLRGVDGGRCGAGRRPQREHQPEGGRPPNTDGPAEEQLFTALTKTATDGVVLENLDPPIFTRPSATAVDAGVPIIALDTSPMEGSKVTTYVGNDNYELGATLAEEALKRMDDDPQGTIVIGVPNPGTPVLDSRAQGIIDTFKEKAPGVKALGPVPDLQRPGAELRRLAGAGQRQPGRARVPRGRRRRQLRPGEDQEGPGRRLPGGGVRRRRQDAGVRQGGRALLHDRPRALPQGLHRDAAADRQRPRRGHAGGLVQDHRPGRRQTNIDDIIARQESPEAAYDFYEDTFAEMLGDVDANMHPLEDAR